MVDSNNSKPHWEKVQKSSGAHRQFRRAENKISSMLIKIEFSGFRENLFVVSYFELKIQGLCPLSISIHILFVLILVFEEKVFIFSDVNVCYYEKWLIDRNYFWKLFWKWKLVKLSVRFDATWQPELVVQTVVFCVCNQGICVKQITLFGLNWLLREIIRFTRKSKVRRTADK